jgi:hypothetical protein
VGEALYTQLELDSPHTTTDFKDTALFAFLRRVKDTISSGKSFSPSSCISTVRGR